ncbi:MAG: TIGR03915 family putative DNA repair protein [Oscillospiraceae bacterium]|nr:TIGR03915 family putative DNA repair protein [Oscillospiraceae bacterium]
MAGTLREIDGCGGDGASLAYDSSFEGLLCALYRCFKGKFKPGGIYPLGTEQGSLLGGCEFVESDEGLARRMHGFLQGRMAEGFRMLYNLYLSERPGIGPLIFDFVRLGVRYGPTFTERHQDPVIAEARKLSGKVGKEAAKLVGLLRFKEVGDGIYYAPLEPEYNVVPSISQHFAERFASLRWVIHDLRRGMGSVYDGSDWYVTELPSGLFESMRDVRADYEAMWKAFHEKLSNPERRNPRCQRRFMPGRYWRHLTEMQL